MGNKTSKVIDIDNIQYHLNNCKQKGTVDCPVYGTLHFVEYNSSEFYIGQATTDAEPSLSSLHYLVPPNLLVIPPFTLLEASQPDSPEAILDIIAGVSQLVMQSGPASIGRSRVAFSGKWGIVGEKEDMWTYREVYEDPQTKGVYLSPQLMASLSQDRKAPSHDSERSDVFALGIMVLEIIFQEQLDVIFDYNNFEIKLKPLLMKLNAVKQEFGEDMYNLLLKMLEFEEDQRVGFQEILEYIPSIRRSNNSRLQVSYMSTSSASQSSRSPLRRKPQQQQDSGYRNGVSPLRGMYTSKNSNANRTPERGAKYTPDQSRVQTAREYQTQRQNNKSPLKRDLRINTRFDKENSLLNASGYSSNKVNPVPYKPTLLRKPGVSPMSRRT